MANETSAKRVLIADDDADLAHVLGLRCRQLGLQVFRSPDAMHALIGSHRMEPDLILLDVNMPGGNGFAVCEMLAGDGHLSAVPIIIMTGESDDSIPRRCQELSVQFVKKGPALWDQLERMICDTLRIALIPAPEVTALQVEVQPEKPRSDSGRPRILCVDDDPDVSKFLKIRLEALGLEVVRAFSGMQGYWFCLDYKPDVIITDLNMPDGEGSYLFYRLKQHPLVEKIPVIVLTGQNNPAVKRHMTSQGISEYLTKPLAFDKLIAVLKRHIEFPERPAPATVRA